MLMLPVAHLLVLHSSKVSEYGCSPNRISPSSRFSDPCLLLWLMLPPRRRAPGRAFAIRFGASTSSLWRAPGGGLPEVCQTEVGDSLDPVGSAIQTAISLRFEGGLDLRFDQCVGLYFLRDMSGPGVEVVSCGADGAAERCVAGAAPSRAWPPTSSASCCK